MNPLESGAGDQRTQPYVFDDIVVDPAAHKLVRGGIEQSIEPKAFDVLILLLQHRGELVARDELLDLVWGHRHVTPGVLTRVVALLRHALGEEANAPRYLHTVHGVGYRFDLPPDAALPELIANPSGTAAPVASEATTPESMSDETPRRRASDSRRVFTRALLWSLPPRDSYVPMTVVPAAERSIAVLPLVNASNDPEQQFFSDGLSESLIGTLSGFEDLKVIGRTSAFQFRDSRDDSATIGRKLGVSYLLGGSVQRAGDVVRINASLTKAADGSTLWAEHYDRPYKDLFALQDEITSAVIRALQVKLLSPGETAQHDDRPPSGNIGAYNAYLQGLKHWHDQDFLKAAEYLVKAVQLDPGYAVAWAHLSGSWSTVATFSNEAPAVAREHMRQARIAADKALQLSPGLGPAHAARAYLQFYDFDYRGALAGCRRAVQLAPTDGTILNGGGYVLDGIGKLGEARRLREQLLSIEPLYTVNYYQYAKLLAATGQLDKATKYLRIAEGLPQPESRPWNLRMDITIARGDVKTAQQVARHQPSPWREMNLAIATQISPDRTAADAALAKVLADNVWAKTSPYDMARLYALRSDAGHTMEWLERAAAQGHGDILFMLTDPLILRFRDDPRLIAFCKQTGLPSPDTSEALSIDQIRAKLAEKR